MARPQEVEKFTHHITFRCWEMHQIILEKLAEKKQIDPSSYMRGLLVRFAKDNGIEYEKPQERRYYNG